MRIKTGKTVPFENKAQLKLALQFLEENFDPTYALIFKVAAVTGLRISDVLNLAYKENINFETSTIYIIESKGTKQAQALEKLKVYKKYKDLAILITQDMDEKTKILVTPPKDIQSIIPSSIKSQLNQELDEAINKAKVKTRTIVIQKKLLAEIKKRQKQFERIDNGYLFARATLKSHRAKNSPGNISRVSVWRVFSQIGDHLKLNFNTSCHQLRKSFAVFLYESCGKNSALVVKTIGWKDDKLLQTYLAIDQEKSNAAIKRLNKNYL